MLIPAEAPLREADLSLSEAARAASAQRWMKAMRGGHFEAAWRETDLLEAPRRAAEIRGLCAREPWNLVWDGTPLANARVLIRCEHGLGDTIQFIRYAPLIRALGSHVTVKAQPMLLPLLRGMEGIDRLLDAWTVEPDPPHDVAIEVMELPYAFRHATAQIPRRVPYLSVDHLHPPSLPADRLNVGLVWAASAWNLKRSVPLSELTPLRDLEAVAFYALQQGPERAQIADAPFPLRTFSTSTDAVHLAAAAILALDLVVTVDTMVAHLAGALGCPTILLLTRDADWRWLSHHEDSPWYPTARLLRQTAPGAWQPVIATLREILLCSTPHGRDPKR